MVIGYGITFALALGLLIGFFALPKKKEFWIGFLFVSVAVVNLGYLLLSLAKSLEFAIFANDVAYAGSVFLPTCMFFTIMKLCGYNIKKAYGISAIAVGIIMLMIVLTSGFLPWYYESVSLETVAGATKLVKAYGPLHPLYLVYLVGYFAMMIITIIHSFASKRIASHKFAGLIAGVVSGNILIWLFEQFISWDFEFLSVSYVFSEVILLLIYWMLQDYVHVNDIPNFTFAEQQQLGVDIKTMPMDVKIGKVLMFVKDGEPLAKREREILEMILDNKKRKDIAAELHLSENTVKTYTRTLYLKLGVRSREELYSLLLQK